jgi:hypothetical protein
VPRGQLIYHLDCSNDWLYHHLCPDFLELIQMERQSLSSFNLQPSTFQDFTRNAPVNTVLISYSSIVSFFPSLMIWFSWIDLDTDRTAVVFQLQPSTFNFSGLHSDCSSEHLLIIAHSHPAGTIVLFCHGIDTDRMTLVSGFHLDCSSEYLLRLNNLWLFFLWLTQDSRLVSAYFPIFHF